MLFYLPSHNQMIDFFFNDYQIPWFEIYLSFELLLKSKTVKREIFLPVKELVLIHKYTPSIRFFIIINFVNVH